MIEYKPQWIQKLLKIFDIKLIAFTIVCTFIMHGQILFQSIIWHDHLFSINDVGPMIQNGRWFLDVINYLVGFLSGNEVLPVVNGLLSAVFIAFSACIVFSLFDINNKLIKYLLVLIFVSIPVIPSEFAYMSGAWQNMFGIFLAFLSCYIFVKGGLQDKTNKLKILALIASAFVLSCSMGVYQCYLTIYLSVILIYYIFQCCNENFVFSKFILTGLIYLSSAVFGLILYFVNLKIVLLLAGASLSNYDNVDSFGITSFHNYLIRAKYCYKTFLDTDLWYTGNVFPFHFKGWYILLIGICMASVILFLLICLVKKEIRKTIQVLFLLFLFPLALNFNYVMYGDVENGGEFAIHSLHMYQMVLLFVLPFVFLTNEHLLLSIKELKRPWKNIQEIVYVVSGITIFLFGILYFRYDNYLYTLSELRQQKALSFCTELKTRIESYEGYDVRNKIVFINEENMTDPADDAIDARYDYPKTNPYSYYFVNGHLSLYLKDWLGYEPSYGNVEDFENLDEVKVMPSYPNANSIKKIDDTIVVKF